MPVEIKPLVASLNDLLQRLNVASQAQRTFIADAAHELRSPLAALKLQLQAASRDGSLKGEGQTLERVEERLFALRAASRKYDVPADDLAALYVLRVLGPEAASLLYNEEGIPGPVLERIPATLLLMVAAITLAVVAGAALGTLAARRVNSPTDNAIAVFSLLSYATPLFWLGLMLIVLLLVRPQGLFGERIIERV